MNNQQIAQNLLHQIENCDADQLAGLCEDIVNQLAILRQCCEEALNDDWDRSDDGFESMKDGIDDLFRQWEP